MKSFIPVGLATLAVFATSCRQDDSDKALLQELRQSNNELRQENKDIREKIATNDKQLAQMIGRFDELQRSREVGTPKANANPIAAPEEAKTRSEADARLRADEIKQLAVATVKKIAAQMDRLMEEIPSVENSLAAWDASMPKVTTAFKNGFLQMKTLVAELDGLKYARTEDVKSKIAGFSNAYQSLPGIGRIVLNSRERTAALRAVANPSKTDMDDAAAEEAAMASQLAVFNAMIAECQKLSVEMSKMAD